MGLLEAADEPADGVVAAGVAVLGDQVLIDPLGGEPLVGLGRDQLAPWLTTAEPAGAARPVGSGAGLGGATSTGTGVPLLRPPSRGRIGWF